MPTSHTPTIQLVVQPTLRVPGEVVEGVAQLYFPNLAKDKIEEVHVKLRGSIYTEITRSTGTSTIVDPKRVHVAKENISLWSSSSGVYPPPDSDILEIPFTFKLPASLPPSFECVGATKSEKAHIRYGIAIVGKRPGVLRHNQRITKGFPVLPPDPSGAELREALQRGWTGSWRTLMDKKQIRKGLWGDHSEVEMTLVIPDIAALPLFSPIPFTLTFVTHSKEMKGGSKSAEEAVFPEPPLGPQAVDFTLTRNVWIKTTVYDHTRKNDFVAQLGGLGSRKSGSGTGGSADVVVTPLKKEWTPSDGEKGEKGRWRQESTFKSTFQLSCAPTFSTETLNASYKLKVKVDYPGIGNSHTAEFPVHVVSGMYPAGERTWDGPPPDQSPP
ncbi:hypothetical protein BC629DRAFT_1284933 [Irpex lacteus]|nr:hypothetical protein BC629DRAFT_1284933 [Irpex lacteus]